MKEREQGFICVARDFLKHPRFAPRGAFTEAEAWLWIVNAAAFKAIRVPIVSGRHKTTARIERGQLTFSIRFMAQAWRWSPGRVARFLNELEMDTSIDTQTVGGQTLITLCNYDTWQMRPKGATGKTGTQTDTQSDTQTDTKKKEGKELKKILPALEAGFAEWYSVYPKKRAGNSAYRAYCKLINFGGISHADLMARTELLAAHWRAQPRDRLQFCPYPASWLNSGQYADEIEAAPSPPSGGGLKIDAPTKPASSFTETEWRDRLAMFGRGQWSTHWGPRPGEPGCIVPAHLQIGGGQ